MRRTLLDVLSVLSSANPFVIFVKKDIHQFHSSSYRG